MASLLNSNVHERTLLRLLSTRHKEIPQARVSSLTPHFSHSSDSSHSSLCVFEALLELLRTGERGWIHLLCLLWSWKQGMELPKATVASRGRTRITANISHTRRASLRQFRCPVAPYSPNSSRVRSRIGTLSGPGVIPCTRSNARVARRRTWGEGSDPESSCKEA